MQINWESCAEKVLPRLSLPPVTHRAFLVCTFWIQFKSCYWSVQKKRIMADKGNPFSTSRGCASEPLAGGREGAAERGLLESRFWVLAQIPHFRIWGMGWEMLQWSEATLLLNFSSDSRTKIWNPVASLTKRWDLTFTLMSPSSLGNCPQCMRWLCRSCAEKSRNYHSGSISTGRFLLLN